MKSFSIFHSSITQKSNLELSTHFETFCSDLLELRKQVETLKKAINNKNKPESQTLATQKLAILNPLLEEFDKLIKQFNDINSPNINDQHVLATNLKQTSHRVTDEQLNSLFSPRDTHREDVNTLYQSIVFGNAIGSTIAAGLPGALYGAGVAVVSEYVRKKSGLSDTRPYSGRLVLDIQTRLTTLEEELRKEATYHFKR